MELAQKNAEERTKHASDINGEIKKIADRNLELEGDNEKLKLDIIKQKSDLTAKFTGEQEKIIQISSTLEMSLEESKRQTEDAETLATDRLGRVGELEAEITTHRTMSEELRIKMGEVEGHHTALQTKFEAECENTEKKLKARERQINELKKELQRYLDKERDQKPKPKPEPIKDESYTPPTQTNGHQEDAPVDLNYLKHVVLRYLTAQSKDREHLVKALAQLLQFSPEETKLISEVFQYKKSWFGVKPEPRGAIAPSIQNVKK